MRIRDWSSDVCSSDLVQALGETRVLERAAEFVGGLGVVVPDSLGPRVLRGRDGLTELGLAVGRRLLGVQLLFQVADAVLVGLDAGAQVEEGFIRPDAPGGVGLGVDRKSTRLHSSN